MPRDMETLAADFTTAIASAPAVDATDLNAERAKAAEAKATAPAPAPEPAKPAADGPGVDELTRQYNDAIAQSEQELPLPIDLNETRMRLAAINGELTPLWQHHQQAVLREELDALTGNVRADLDLPGEFTAPLLESLLTQALGQIDGAQDAWEARHEDPAAWQAMLMKALPLVNEAAAPMAAAIRENQERNDVLRAKRSVSNVSLGPVSRPTISPQEGFEMTERQWLSHIKSIGAA